MRGAALVIPPDPYPLQFADAMRDAGLEPPDSLHDDGKIHRFASNGKPGDDAGWYALHGDGIPAGIFGCWREGINQTWKADIGRPWTPAEQTAHKTKLQALQTARDAEKAKVRSEAAIRARTRYEAAQTATDEHPYLTRKGIQAHGVKLEGERLMIPMYADGLIQSLQFIGPMGDKKFLSGGRVTGCYFSLGSIRNATALYIAEGFATGATIHELTGQPVAVAFNAGNLEPVAEALRATYPDLALIVCADDDFNTSGNPGLTCATKAARAVGGLLAVPDFGFNREVSMTDFNDMAAHCGREAVSACLAACLDSETTIDYPLAGTDVTAVTDVQVFGSAVCAVTSPVTADVTDVTNDAEPAIPNASKRPCFKVFDDWTDKKLRPGVWFFGIKAAKKADDPPIETQQWICSPLHIEAVTFDNQDNNFGRLLRFKTTLGKWRDWAMPMALLSGAGDELRGGLLSMGVEIDPLAKNLLMQYLQYRPPTRRVHCALQVGWYGNSFVLPDTVIGAKASSVIFQSGESGHDEHTQAGTLTGWQAGVAARAVGNPMLTLALSAAFAGPLLERCNGESGGIHFTGESATGKSTAMNAACSVWGGANYRRSWSATANGMEGAAALFNDCLLALDEISQCEPKYLGPIVYGIGNGCGKQRANRNGNARSVTHWRCFVLSNGEKSVATAMLEGGFKAKAGQSVRLLDIAIKRRFGAWDDVQGLADGRAFSEAINLAAKTHHGIAGRAFLEKLTREKRNFGAELARINALPEFETNGGEGQEKRAAGRFALVALAGEIATEYGITGWPEGATIDAAAIGFAVWRSQRGRGNSERRQITEQVSDFIERHGDSRFSDADAPTHSDARCINRAGWWRDQSGERVYLFNASGLREALQGFDFKQALDTLQEAGALPKPDASGERSKGQRIANKMARVYSISPDKLVPDHGA